jgi:DNA-binding NtrC family response regulator
MSLSAQAKVLRVLTTGELQRVGGEGTLRVDVRVIAATNRDLVRAVQAGAFREDLYFRLNVIPLRVPPLRERPGDLPKLVEAFVAACCGENGVRLRPVEPAAMARLLEHRWPGNVRELRNLIERAVVLSEGMITVADLPDLGEPLPGAGATLREFRDRMEREFIWRKLEEFGWNVSRTAEALGIERTNLHKKMRAYGIARDE